MLALHDKQEYLAPTLLDGSPETEATALVSFEYINSHDRSVFGNVHHRIAHDVPSGITRHSLISGPPDRREAILIKSIVIYNNNHVYVRALLEFYGVAAASVFPEIVGHMNGEFVGPPVVPIVERSIPPQSALIWSEGGGWQVVPDTPRMLAGVPLVFGAENVVATGTDTRFLLPGYFNGQADANAIGIVCPRGDRITKLYVRHHAAVGNGNPVEYKVRVNGVESQLKVTLPTGVTGTAVDEDPAHAVPVAAGQLVEVVAVKSANLGSGAVRAVATLLVQGAG